MPFKLPTAAPLSVEVAVTLDVSARQPQSETSKSSAAADARTALAWSAVASDKAVAIAAMLLRNELMNLGELRMFVP